MEVEDDKTLTPTTTTPTPTPTTPTTAETTDKKRRLNINYDELFGEGHDKPDEELVVVPVEPQRRPRRRKLRKSSEDDDPLPASSSSNEYSSLTDSELKIQIDRNEKLYANCSVKLPDGGVKLLEKLKAMKDDLERRQNRRSQEVIIDENKKPVQSEISGIEGDTTGSKQASSEAPSGFANSFLKKLDNNTQKVGQNTTNEVSEAFNAEISSIYPRDKSQRAGGRQLQIKKPNPALHSKEFSAWTPKDGSRNGGKSMRLNGKMASLSLLRHKSAGSFSDEDDSRALDSNNSKNEETVVLVDEEEPELIEKKQDAKELPLRLNECKIYYPSREDPESLEILRSELTCLDPGECLTSTIMNFYVRYLQEGCSKFNFYFFNTYFYNKLQNAVGNQQNDKEAFFMKFRRWWKGVNIFEKAYIFLPINEDNHWSLVIICIPDKEGESGLIILHLDSLGLHSSDSIFDNIKSLLINEWRILNEDVGYVNIPLHEKIWSSLPRKIEHKSIRVPRQNNDYDCGLFVLYYMELFIKEAPERLTKQDYSMFGKNWFKPQEASGLRKKIKGILQEKFREAVEQDKCTFVPVCLSSKAETVKTIYF